jgi:hypothetical protein
LVHFSPEFSELGLGQEREIELRIDNVSGLYGIEIQMTFARAIVEILDLDPAVAGVQVLQGDYPAPDFVVKNDVRNDSGTVWYAVTQVSPREALSGSGRVFTIRVKGRTAGSCELAVYFAQLVDGEAMEITSAKQNGEVLVTGEATAVPPPPSRTPTVNQTIPAGPTPTAGPGATRTPLPSTLVPTRSTTTTLSSTTPSPTPLGSYPQPGVQGTGVPTPQTSQEMRGYPTPGGEGAPLATPTAQATELPTTEGQGQPGSTVPPATPLTEGPETTPTEGAGAGETEPTVAPEQQAEGAQVAALVPSLEPLPTVQAAPRATKPTIPQGLFVCLLLVTALFTLLLGLYLTRWQKHFPQ